MFVLHKSLNSWNLVTDFWRRGEEIDKRRLEEVEVQAGTEMAITSYRIPLAPVTSFKYLDRILSVPDGDWIEVVHNLRRARHKWARMSRVPIREGADART